MKKYKNLITILGLLNIYQLTLSMEEKNFSVEQPKPFNNTNINDMQEPMEIDNDNYQEEQVLVGIFPNELWYEILKYVFYNQEILDGSTSISDGVKKLNRYFTKISQTCKLFLSFNLKMNVLHKSLLKEQLKEQFLELRNKGFYPKNGRWSKDNSLNDFISDFMQNYKDKGVIRALTEGIEDEGELRAKLVCVLKFYGANVDHTNNYNKRTALMNSVRDGNEKLVLALLSLGAKINAKDEQGRTALFFASNKMAEILIKHKADVNARNNSKETVLILASKAGYEELVELLLISGAQVDAKDNSNRTALKWALVMGHDKVAKILSLVSF